MNDALHLPPLRELAPDLTRISPVRRFFALGLPFFWCGAYFVFAALNCWPTAVFATVALSFVTYGSISHDLVHRNLGLRRFTNDLFLSLIELLALRSGHAYQAAHLHHHARFPHEDDVESTAARRSFLGAVLEGFTFQVRIWLWAVKNAPHARTWIVAEGACCVCLIAASAALTAITPIFIIYATLMVMGSWIIPLITSYIPHDPHADSAMRQTRVFRGIVASWVALDHLFHLEHHLYPAVPHHHWPELARRLDPYFAKAGVKAIHFWF